MSDHLIYWIPADPAFVPSDCGENLEAIFCPRCATELDMDWWHEAMDRSYATSFTDRDITLPCCRARARLEDLDYRWSQGFARFILEARNANIGAPTEDDDAQVARLLGTPVRRILAHY
ncbi:MAG TPA: hypothetical protein VF765_15195 [Polyangiaceae bacterium]